MDLSDIVWLSEGAVDIILYLATCRLARSPIKRSIVANGRHHDDVVSSQLPNLTAEQHKIQHNTQYHSQAQPHSYITKFHVAISSDGLLVLNWDV